MRHRLRSAGFLGALLALIGPELAITTATVVLTPAVAEAQAGGVHRRTRRRTRRRTAAVVHTADMNQAAAQQQQQQQQQPQAEPQSQLPGTPHTAPSSVSESAVSVVAATTAPEPTPTDAGAPGDRVARAPPEFARTVAPGSGGSDGQAIVEL